MALYLYSLLMADQTKPLIWTKEIQGAFTLIKGSLHYPSALGHPNYKLPFFFFFVHEREGSALSVLTQCHGDQHNPIGYYMCYITKQI